MVGKRNGGKASKGKRFMSEWGKWIAMTPVAAAAIVLAILLIKDSGDAAPMQSITLDMHTPAPTATIAPTSTPTPVPTPTPAPTPYVKPIPLKLYFPTFDIESDIFPVKHAKDGTIGTLNSATDTAWYEPFAAPGEPGNCILNGHVSWKGKKGYFANIKDMKKGDPVVIGFEGGELRYFEITDILSYRLEEFPQEHLVRSGDTRLTLITCKGDYDRSIGTSRTRIVAICKPADPPPGVLEALKDKQANA